MEYLGSVKAGDLAIFESRYEVFWDITGRMVHRKRSPADMILFLKVQEVNGWIDV